ncbi:serine/threonine-protein kinase [Candidatus Uabimicrobium amorphum]|uniref:Protein kinase n=1 Tax=Uabimicrobium amorphum TaxID=2596890 RepID=A0A5S9IQK4_UABAM|nr:serine/threonine-protein kinase [Candidatus Uabimicrobium amorphum]BBM86278.1 protein kinase [Candidatus Uabimicrobium amorphum]
MDNDTFRSLWSKILEQDSSSKHSVRNTYKSKEMTFSHDITVFPAQQTFSGDGTIHSTPATDTFSEDSGDGKILADHPSPTDTFSEDSTVSPEESFASNDVLEDTSSQDATVTPEDSAEKVTFSATETTAPKSRARIQASFNTEEDYQNYQEINRGGMGIIYRAEQTKLKREIAIKKTLPQVEKNKFLAESLVTAYLDHPNIVPIYEMEQNNSGDILLAMKLVKGISWKDLLYPQTSEHKEKAKEYNLQKHLEILINVCNAVNYAHSKGVAHCDLKPDNIMIGDFGEVLVMDWGIAVDVRENPDERRTFHKSDVKTPMGTPCYMAPELAEGRGKDISFATDVYLLGGILYEILQRKPPHTAKSLWLVLLAAKESKPVSFRDKTSLQLRQICHKAMAKKISDRYQNVTEFKKAVEDYLQHRESIMLANKATELFNKTNRYINQHVKSDKYYKFKYVFYEAPGKILFPYWWLNASKVTKRIFIATILMLFFTQLPNAFSNSKFDVWHLIGFTIFAPASYACGLAVIINFISLICRVILWLSGKKNIYVFPPLEISPYRVYTDLIKAIGLYDQSIAAWKGNEAAKQNKLKLHARIADLALDFKDVKLAKAHLEILKKVNATGLKNIREKARQAEIEEKADSFVGIFGKLFGVVVFWLPIVVIITVIAQSIALQTL